MAKKPIVTTRKPDLAANKTRLQAVKPNLTNLLAAEPEPDPLADVEYGQGLEADTTAETSALLAGFRARAKQEQDRFLLATDTEFWISIGFQSREQKEAFLAVLDWLQFGDKYLDGTQIAASMGITLPEVQLGNRAVKPDRKLRKLVKR